MEIILVQEKYNYRKKFERALKNKDEKYIKSLFKRGKAIITNIP